MSLILTITNETAAALSYELPDGGTVPASGSRAFVVTNEQWEAAAPAVEASRDAGDITYTIAPHATRSDGGDRVYKHEATFAHGDFTADATSETVEDTYTFPVGARLLGYYKTLNAAFAGGAVSACVLDAGISAAAADVLDDGQNVFTGAALVESFGAGTNATPTQPHNLGGKKLRAKLVSTDANVSALTAGSVTLTVLYAII